MKFYRVTDIQNWLKDVANKPYAASQFWSYITNDSLSNDGLIELEDAADWFKDYFPRGESYLLFESMMNHCEKVVK